VASAFSLIFHGAVSSLSIDDARGPNKFARFLAAHGFSEEELAAREARQVLLAFKKDGPFRDLPRLNEEAAGAIRQECSCRIPILRGTPKISPRVT